MRIPRLIMLALASLACSSARETPPVRGSRVEWSASAGRLLAAPGNGYRIDVELRARISDGWHIYSLDQTSGGPVPLSVTVAPSPPYSLDGRPTGPRGEKSLDSNFGIETETYSREAVIRVPVKLSSGNGGAPPLELSVRSQACSDRVCLPARTEKVLVNTATPAA